MKRCKSCQGTYRPTTPEGAPYFHVCGPERWVRVKRADGTRATVRPSQVRADDAFIRDVFRERPDKRNENTLRREGDRGEIRVLVAEGLGVEDVPDPDPED